MFLPLLEFDWIVQKHQKMNSIYIDILYIYRQIIWLIKSHRTFLIHEHTMEEFVFFLVSVFWVDKLVISAWRRWVILYIITLDLNSTQGKDAVAHCLLDKEAALLSYLGSFSNHTEKTRIKFFQILKVYCFQQIIVRNASQSISFICQWEWDDFYPSNGIPC